MLINCGLYSFFLSTKISSVIHNVSLIYGDASTENSVADFHLSLTSESLFRRFIKRQVNFRCDQHSPFKPLPITQAYALLEWGMNWCVAAHDFSHFLLHSAVLVKNNQAILCPAAPGSGKSTLSAYLGLSDWFVYSDEMAIIDIETQKVKPIYRPVCLKNDSIALMKNWHPDAVITPVCRDTQKGDVAHVKVLSWHQYQQLSPVPIAALVFPKFIAGSDLKIYKLNQLDAFSELSRNAFNYNVLGETAFNIAADIVDSVGIYQVEYSDLVELATFFEELVQV